MAPSGVYTLRADTDRTPGPSTAAMDAAAEILRDLGRDPPRLSPKFLYDARGSALFEAITALPEYYLTRTEADILSSRVDDIRKRVGQGRTVIDLGAGTGAKAITLCRLIRPVCYVAVDIAPEVLKVVSTRLGDLFPDLPIHVVAADLCDRVVLPREIPQARRLAFYPGSSLGNFDPPEAEALLSRVRGVLGEDGVLLMGIDLVKDVVPLEAAYNDVAGVTAAFNLNILGHINGLVGSNFDSRDWRHRAFFNGDRSRMEMHLEAAVDVKVRWPGGGRDFSRGERIHTESSYKYRIEDVETMLGRAGFGFCVNWTDERGWFAVFLASVDPVWPAGGGE